MIITVRKNDSNQLGLTHHNKDYTKQEFKQYCKESIKDVKAEIENLLFIIDNFKNHSIDSFEIPFENDVYAIKTAVDRLHGKINIL